MFKVVTEALRFAISLYWVFHGREFIKLSIDFSLYSANVILKSLISIINLITQVPYVMAPSKIRHKLSKNNSMHKLNNNWLMNGL